MLKDRKVLVTGADGFIGSHLVEALVKTGACVKAFVFYNSFNTWGWLDSLAPQIMDQVEVCTGDIRDPHGVKNAVHDCGIIFHLAALIGIPFSYHSPDSYLDTNVKGTLNVLQAAREHNCEKIIITSTSEVYGTAQYVPIDESHPRQGQSPYSASKIAADFLAQSFHRSFGLPVITVRPFNTYGPRQSARAVIPTIIAQLLAGARKVRLGALKPRRDLVFVKDTVEGFIRLACCEEAVGEEVNISTGHDISIEELARKIIGIINPRAEIAIDNKRLRPANSEVICLMGDNNKLKKLTGWTPTITIDEGLRRTVEWFRSINITRWYKPDLYNV